MQAVQVPLTRSDAGRISDALVFNRHSVRCIPAQEETWLIDASGRFDAKTMFRRKRKCPLSGTVLLKDFESHKYFFCMRLSAHPSLGKL